jgi:DNA-binding GntR family transcriptional regulator
VLPGQLYILSDIFTTLMPADSIDPLSATPVYQQLADILRAQIEAGTLQRNRPLPSEVALMETYGVSRGSVRHALEVLREAGLVVTVPGRGTYVTP